MKMTSAQVVETPVKVTTNSPSQDYTHPDDHNLRIYDMTPGFKPFTVFENNMSLRFQRQYLKDNFIITNTQKSLFSLKNCAHICS